MSKHTQEYLISQVILYDDHKAFEALMSKHQNDIRNLLLKLTNFNESDVQDLSQESILRIYKYLKSYKGSASFTTWIYKITYRVFLDAQKAKGKYQQMKMDKTKMHEKKQIVHPHIYKQMDAEIIIACLRPEEKIAIQLSYLKGFSHADIAEILGCPLGTVKSHINRGKERIRNNFKR